MSDTLLHFPIYIGDALKKFIELPSLEERGAWISIVVAMIHNDGELPTEAELYRYALIFSEQDKQSLSKALAKLKQKDFIKEVNVLINKQKTLRKARQAAGSKGGKKSKKNKQSLQQNVSNSESESESESKPELESKTKNRKKIALADLSVDHIKDWLAEKRIQGKYVFHDEYHVLDQFRNYCESKGKKYANYIAGYRNAFEWDRCQPKAGINDRHQRTLEAAARGHMRAENPDF